MTIGVGDAVTSIPVDIGVSHSATGSMMIGIAEQSAGIPILPLAASCGGGNVLFTWIPPSGMSPYGYEIQACTELDGTYFPYGRSFFKNALGMISNLPYGRSMFFRIRSLTEDGNFSDWIQFKLGILQQQSTVMRIKAPYGSLVASGARVAILDMVDRYAGFFASGNFVVTGNMV